VVLTGGAVAAAVPGRLAAPMLKAAAVVAGGNVVPAGVIPAEVETLSRRVVGAMFVAKVKTAVAVLFAAGLAVVGVGSLSYLRGQPAKAGAGDPPKAAQPPAEGPTGAGPRSPYPAVLDAVKGIENKTERVVLLIRVAQGQAGAGDTDSARETLRQSLALADALEGDTPRGMALREIATTRLRLGDVEEATAIAGKFHGESHRNHLLFLLAAQQAEAGDILGARKTAAAITDDQKDGAIEAAGRAEARAGDVEASRETADALKHQPLSRAGVLEELALAQARKGDRAAAAASLREALRLNDATLADAKNRNGARAENAVRQARIGDVAGALRAAAALDFDTESGYPDRAYALRHIAVEQAKQGDTPGSLKTLRDIPDDADRARALVGLAEAQAGGNDRAGAEKTFAAARDIAVSLPGAGKADILDDIAAARAGVQVKAGDVTGALETARGMESDRSRCWVLLDVARAQANAGNLRAARVTLGQAMKAADGFPEGEENQGSVTTLVPAWALIKGSVVRQVASRVSEAGGGEDARAWAAGQRSPFIKVMALLGIADGVSARDAGGKKPTR
ncbi:MAG: tolB 1, partial [Gemmataceae bacterium]|nr:tolB 1 [Gemmataceae bacterium]